MESIYEMDGEGAETLGKMDFILVEGLCCDVWNPYCCVDNLRGIFVY